MKTFPGFYQELIELWYKISYQEPSDIIQIYNQCLWNNSFILRQGKPIFNLSFINKGILRVSDILNPIAYGILQLSQLWRGGGDFYPTTQKTMLKLFDWFEIWYT